MRLFIEPTETLLFRNGRPFVAGENNFAQTIFPPTPETLQGAIRATIAAYWEPGKTIAEAFAPKSNGEESDLVNLIGKFDKYNRFRVTGISLGRREDDGKITRLFPAPVHILEDEKSKEQVRLVLKPHDEQHLLTNLPKDMDLLYPEKVVEDADKLEPISGWLTEQELEKALSPVTQGSSKQVKVVKERDICERESRLGIGMNNQRKATETGLLYQMEMVRMKPHYGFVVDITLVLEQNEAVAPRKVQETLHLPDSGWMTLGGERRAARFQVIEPSSDTLEQNTHGNMLYLATPASFDYGWQPGDWAKFGIQVKPAAVAIERYAPIGGWQLTPGSSGGQDKPLRRCVPAGTVYFFRQNIDIPAVFTDNGKEIGYGIAYAGQMGQ